MPQIEFEGRNPQNPAEKPQGEFAGIADEQFRDYIISVADSLVPSGNEGYFNVIETLKPQFFFLEGEEGMAVSARFAARLRTLSQSTAVYSDNRLGESGKTVIADRSNILIAASYLYGRKSILEDSGRVNPRISDSLEVGSALWGSHQLGEVLSAEARNLKLQEKEKKAGKPQKQKGESGLLFGNLQLGERGMDFILNADEIALGLEKADLQWIEERISNLQRIRRQNPLSAATEENPWKKTDIPKEYGWVVEFIRLACGRSLRGFHVKDFISAKETEMGLQLAAGVIRKRPDMPNLLALFSGVKELVDANPKYFESNPGRAKKT